MDSFPNLQNNKGMDKRRNSISEAFLLDTDNYEEINTTLGTFIDNVKHATIVKRVIKEI